MGCAPTRQAERRFWTLLRGALAVLFFMTLGASVTASCSGYDRAQLTPDQLDAGGFDESCVDSPSQGDRCTKDCVEATCHGGTGRRLCTCQGGVYSQCICLPPEGWPYPSSPTPVAPWCDEITGQPRYLHPPNQPTGDRCENPGQQCVSSTFPDEGCTCTTDSLGRSSWICGSLATMMVPEGAPACESFGTGKRTLLAGKACDTEFDMCVARDYETGSTTPRGCVCLHRDDASTILRWVCGSTNRWFRPE